MLAILERSDAIINKSSAPTPHHDVAAFQAQAPHVGSERRLPPHKNMADREPLGEITFAQIFFGVIRG
jgi:hypothetical protein